MARTAVGGPWGDDEWRRHLDKALEPLFEQQRQAMEPLMGRIREATDEALAPVRESIRQFTDGYRAQIDASLSPIFDQAARAAVANSGLAQSMEQIQDLARRAIPSIQVPMPTISSEALERLASVDWSRIEQRLEDDPQTADLARPSVDWAALGTVDGLIALVGVVLAVRGQVVGWGDQTLADDLWDLAALLLATANVIWILRPKSE